MSPPSINWPGNCAGASSSTSPTGGAFKPYYTTLALLAVIRELYPEQFAWRQPPYEYETVRLPFDLLTGDDAIREGLEDGLTAGELEAAWQEDLNRFMEVRREFLLYPE